MTEIKPCPRGHAVADIGFDDEFEAHVIRCMECNWRTWGHTESEAIEGWNTRTPDPSLIAGLREAREAGQALYDAVGAWEKPESGWFTPAVLQAGERWSAVLVNLDTLLSQEGQP